MAAFDGTTFDFAGMPGHYYNLVGPPASSCNSPGVYSSGSFQSKQFGFSFKRLLLERSSLTAAALKQPCQLLCISPVVYSFGSFPPMQLVLFMYLPGLLLEKLFFDSCYIKATLLVSCNVTWQSKIITRDKGTGASQCKVSFVFHWHTLYFMTVYISCHTPHSLYGRCWGKYGLPQADVCLSRNNFPLEDALWHAETVLFGKTIL